MTSFLTQTSLMYDAVVVGGGPAGASAATLLGRAMRNVLVVDAGQTRNRTAEHVHGFLGLDGMSPSELQRRGRHEAEHYGCRWSIGLITSARRHRDGSFELEESDGSLHRARTVIVATGLRDVLPPVEGLNDLWGRGVAHCPYCHGYEVRGSDIGILGGHNRPFSLHQTELLRLWSDDVTFFPDVIELTDSERAHLTQWGVHIIDGRVRRVLPIDDKIAIEIADGTVVDRSTLFVGPEFSPNQALLGELGCNHTEDGWTAIDGSGATSVAGVWAAGNVTDSPAQLIHAAAQGTRTGIAVNRSLLNEDMTSASQRSN